LLVVETACRNRPPDEADYVARMAAARAAKDADFLKSPEPVPENLKAEMLPLAYFPIDPSYNVPAILRPVAVTAEQGDGAPPKPDGALAPGVVLMPTSTGTERQMRRVGTLEFTLKGQPMKLTAFVEAAAPDVRHLFVPFSDMTSGTQTYPAGRYLDLDRNVTGIYEVDFNKAYHPFCYFSPTYECPYPPAENRLKSPIHAGEKLKK
jgi:uncharacterized protein (DUF1684 family)